MDVKKPQSTWCQSRTASENIYPTDKEHNRDGPVWHGDITVHEIMALEKVQMVALAIIRGQQHTTYSEALIHFGLGTL